jgi:5-methylcytosine-specific restriction endonuclease McrA
MRELRQNPPYKIIQNQKRRIRTICKNKGYHKTSEFNNIFGIDAKGLKQYMETLFVDGMTWDNYGEWEVDHIVPLETVNSFEDLSRLSHYKNLQPLWENDHKTKTKLCRTK